MEIFNPWNVSELSKSVLLDFSQCSCKVGVMLTQELRGSHVQVG